MRGIQVRKLPDFSFSFTDISDLIIPSDYKTSLLFQLALSNPNQKVLQTLASSGVLELIGKEWYFVRVHDAVQVCLQHVQNLKETPKRSDATMKNESSILQRARKQHDDLKEPLMSSNV